MYLDDPVTQAFFDVAREKLCVEGELVSEHFLSRSHTGRIITKSGQKGGQSPVRMPQFSCKLVI